MEINVEEPKKEKLISHAMFRYIFSFLLSLSLLSLTPSTHTHSLFLSRTHIHLNRNKLPNEKAAEQKQKYEREDIKNGMPNNKQYIISSVHADIRKRISCTHFHSAAIFAIFITFAYIFLFAATQWTSQVCAFILRL